MAIYLLKTMTLMALFWGFYQLVLRKEKMLKFNRFFLLFSITASFLIPFWISSTSYRNISSSSTPSAEMESWTSMEVIETSSMISWESFLGGIYAMGVFLMLIRFGKKLYPILQRIREGKQIRKEGYIQILHPSTQQAFSFLHFIFLPTSENTKLLLKHELAHVKQKHSLDILWVEFLHCLAWFNPMIIPLKRAIRLNHEFLADQSVTRELHSPEPYVQLILQKASAPRASMLVSPLNMGQTRERFEMIFTSNNKVMKMLKQLLCILFILASCQLFGREHIVWQSENHLSENSLSVEALSSEGNDEVFKDLNMEDGGMMLYVEVEGRKGRYILGWVVGEAKVRFLNEAGEWTSKICNELSQAEREWFWNLEASKAQVFRKVIASKEPSPAQMKDFQNPEKYGLWLNGKRTPNYELANFTPDKILSYNYSKLMKNAAHYGQYTYHLTVETKAYMARKYSAEKGGHWEDVYLKEKEHYKKLFKK